MSFHEARDAAPPTSGTLSAPEGINPKCHSQRRAAGRPLRRIALRGSKVTLTATNRDAGSAAPNPLIAGCTVGARRAHRLDMAHLVLNFGSIGLPFVAATNWARHSATPMLPPLTSALQW